MSVTSQLQQINARYLNVEDRILLRTSTSNHEEFLIWLTRRYTAILLDVLTQEIETRGGTTTISNKSETKALFKQGVFEKEYSEDNIVKRPLGDKGILAFALKTAKDQHGNLIIEMQSEIGKGISYNLNDALLYMLYSLLTQCVRAANWQLDDRSNTQIDNALH